MVRKSTPATVAALFSVMLTPGLIAVMTVPAGNTLAVPFVTGSPTSNPAVLAILIVLLSATVPVMTEEAAKFMVPPPDFTKSIFPVIGILMPLVF